LQTLLIREFTTKFSSAQHTELAETKSIQGCCL